MAVIFLRVPFQISDERQHSKECSSNRSKRSAPKLVNRSTVCLFCLAPPNPASSLAFGHPPRRQRSVCRFPELLQSGIHGMKAFSQPFSGPPFGSDQGYNAAAMIPPLPARQLQEAFSKFIKDREIPSSLPYPDSVKIRCAIVDYILHSEEGSLEERLLEFVAATPLDV